MQYTFSSNLQGLKPSAIREILKHTSGTDVIPFAAGNPAVEVFPVAEIAAITAGIMKRPPAEFLQYGISEGYAPLRDWLKNDLAEKGLKFDGDELIVTSGAQQAIDIVSQIFCDPGDVILCEDPSFIGALNAFRSHGIRLRGIPMVEGGMDLDALEQALKEEKRAKLLYIIPNFQNPTGITTTAEKRRAIYALAQRYDIVILEDNPYGDLRFAGEEVANIKSFDTDGRVLYVGSFSKLLAPGMRVGYLLGSAEAVQKATIVKQTADVHTNLVAQITVHGFVSGYDLKKHIAMLQSVYRRKYGIMAAGLKANVPDAVSFTQPEGGLFVLGTLPQRLDVTTLCRGCIERKLAVVPGSAFSPDPGQTPHTVRLNFSTPSDEQIERGCAILGGVIREML